MPSHTGQSAVILPDSLTEEAGSIPVRPLSGIRN
jgi:hypothetical protein